MKILKGAKRLYPPQVSCPMRVWEIDKGIYICCRAEGGKISWVLWVYLHFESGECFMLPSLQLSRAQARDLLEKKQRAIVFRERKDKEDAIQI